MLCCPTDRPPDNCDTYSSHAERRCPKMTQFTQQNESRRVYRLTSNKGRKEHYMQERITGELTELNRFGLVKGSSLVNQGRPVRRCRRRCTFLDYLWTNIQSQSVDQPLSPNAIFNSGAIIFTDLFL